MNKSSGTGSAAGVNNFRSLNHQDDLEKPAKSDVSVNKNPQKKTPRNSMHSDGGQWLPQRDIDSKNVQPYLNGMLKTQVQRDLEEALKNGKEITVGDGEADLEKLEAACEQFKAILNKVNNSEELSVLGGEYTRQFNEIDQKKPKDLAKIVVSLSNQIMKWHFSTDYHNAIKTGHQAQQLAKEINDIFKAFIVGNHDNGSYPGNDPKRDSETHRVHDLIEKFNGLSEAPRPLQGEEIINTESDNFDIAASRQLEEPQMKGIQSKSSQTETVLDDLTSAESDELNMLRSAIREASQKAEEAREEADSLRVQLQDQQTQQANEHTLLKQELEQAKHEAEKLQANLKAANDKAEKMDLLHVENNQTIKKLELKLEAKYLQQLAVVYQGDRDVLTYLFNEMRAAIAEVHQREANNEGLWKKFSFDVKRNGGNIYNAGLEQQLSYLRNDVQKKEISLEKAQSLIVKLSDEIKDLKKVE